MSDVPYGWPMTTDGRPVLPGMNVKLPGCGCVVHVMQVSFGVARGCCYLNGFVVLDGEAVEEVAR